MGKNGFIKRKLMRGAKRFSKKIARPIGIHTATLIEKTKKRIREQPQRAEERRARELKSLGEKVAIEKQKVKLAKSRATLRKVRASSSPFGGLQPIKRSMFNTMPARKKPVRQLKPSDIKIDLF